MTDDMLKTKLKERAGPEKAAEVDAMKFGEIKKSVFAFSPLPIHCFSQPRRMLIEILCSMRQSIEDDMNTIRASPYLKKDMKVFGFLFDITKGTVTDVKEL